MFTPPAYFEPHDNYSRKILDPPAYCDPPFITGLRVCRKQAAGTHNMSCHAACFCKKFCKTGK